jgi:O-antigen/teichoic acid export membrane protein
MSSISKAKAFLNVFANWIGFAAGILIAFFMAPFMVHQLGDSDYGLWILIGSFIGYMGLIDMGLNNAIVRYASKYIELDDTDKLNQTFVSALIIFVVMAVLIVVLIGTLGQFFPKVFSVDKSDFEITLIILLATLDFAISLPVIVFQAMVKAKQEFVVLNLSIIIGKVLQTALFVKFLLAGHSIVSLLVIDLSLNVAFGIFFVVYVFRISPQLKLRGTKVTKESLRNLLSYSFFNFLVAVSNRLIYQTDVLVIGAYASTSMITFYAIGANLINYLHSFMRGLHTTLIPRASELDAREKHDAVSKLLLDYSRYGMLIAVPIIAIFLFYGETFIGLWMGPKYAAVAGDILVILSLAKFVNIPQLITNSVLRGIGKLKALSAIRIGEGVANLILSLILVKKYGLMGVAIGTLIPSVISNAIILPIYICKRFHCSLPRYYWESLLQPSLVLLFLFLCNRLIDIQPANYLAFVGAICLNLVIHAVCVYAFCLSRIERTHIHGFVLYHYRNLVPARS